MRLMSLLISVKDVGKIMVGCTPLLCMNTAGGDSYLKKKKLNKKGRYRNQTQVIDDMV